MARYVIEVPVEPDWIGRSITGEWGKSESLRNALVDAQNDCLDLIEDHPTELTLRWEVEDLDGRWHWNPQYGIPDGSTTLFCIAEDFRAS